MRHVFLIFTFWVVAVTLSAEAPLPADEFAKLSLADAAKAIDVAELNSALRTAYAAAVLESKRSDLVAFCFENQSMDISFAYAVSKLPDSPYKEEVMLMMLKSTSPFWDRLKNMMRYPGHLDIDKTSVPFRTLIKKYLPDAPLNDGMIATREARTKLADKIEAVKNPSPHAQIEPKVKTVELVGANNPQSPASSPSLVQTAPAAEKPALAFDRLAPAWPWVVGAVTLIAIVMAALRRRS